MTIKVEVQADGLMVQLGEEIIESYDTGESGAAVDDLIIDILAFQRKATQITKGTISVTGTRALSITNRSILSVLLQLQESIGGYMYVDTDRKLQWPTTIGEDKGQQIRYRKNLIGITKDIDYSGFCTKLHPASSDESLSDISIGPVAVDTDTDATYGYIILKETYACYLDWVEVGAALPPNVTIWKQNAAPSWVVPSGVDSAPGWTDTADAKDDDWNTDASSNSVTRLSWTSYITFSINSATYQTVKWKLGDSGIGIDKVQIDVYNGAEWTTIYYGHAYTGPKEADFAAQICEKIRVRGYTDNSGNPLATGQLELYECHLYESDITDVTTDWLSGADERTCRAAIADFDGAATYQISYTYADYLKAWDKIVDNDDIRAKVVTNKYEAYAVSILEAAILLLDELKEIPITYTIRAIDLSKNEDFDFAFDALQLGSTLTVIDEGLNIEVSVKVVTLTRRDLSDPQNIDLELSTRLKDISDYLADLGKRFG